MGSGTLVLGVVSLLGDLGAGIVLVLGVPVLIFEGEAVEAGLGVVETVAAIGSVLGVATCCGGGVAGVTMRGDGGEAILEGEATGAGLGVVDTVGVDSTIGDKICCDNGDDGVSTIGAGVEGALMLEVGSDTSVEGIETGEDAPEFLSTISVVETWESHGVSRIVSREDSEGSSGTSSSSLGGVGAAELVAEETVLEAGLLLGLEPSSGFGVVDLAGGFFAAAAEEDAVEVVFLAAAGATEAPPTGFVWPYLVNTA
jgi:hypothetical protein